MRERAARISIAALAASAAPAPAAADALPLRPPDATGPLRTERLSDERWLSRWAHTRTPAPILRAPRPGARRIGRLRDFTEDWYPEVYLLLRSHVAPGGRTWVQLRIPGRPNGRVGWVRRQALGAINRVRGHLLVDKSALRATLYRDGRAIWSSPVGIGAPGTPTPAGRFWIREKIAVPDPGGIYGPWALGTAAYSVLSDWPAGGVVGIHGTNQPGLIPGRPSHGCIRVRNRAIARLARLVAVGTPLRIRP